MPKWIEEVLIVYGPMLILILTLGSGGLWTWWQDRKIGVAESTDSASLHSSQEE